MDENVIPWEQIEPLVKPGMNGRELAIALLSILGLPTDNSYALATVRTATTFQEALRGGVRIIRGDAELDVHLDGNLESVL